MNIDTSSFTNVPYPPNGTANGGHMLSDRRVNIPAPLSGLQSPDAGSFQPLLPSNLLVGSPFQPGTQTFPSSPLGGFPGYSGNMTPAPSQQNQLSTEGQPPQNLIPPPIYSPMLTTDGMNGSLLAPQSPVNGFSPFANAAFGTANASLQLPGILSGASRTVYLGNIPAETSAEEILGHVRSGQIESVRLLLDKNCAFISFLDSSSATHFHSDAILKKLAIRGNDIKIGWGKPSQVSTTVALAVQQSGASRNVYLGNLPEDITEDDIREDLGRFGQLDTIKIVREKSIAFVHFLCISNAMKAVSQLPQEPKWQLPRRVNYGKDRCAYVSKTQQQNAAQYLGIAPGHSAALNSSDRDLISNALAQQSVAAAAVATTAGGVNNLGNRTVYLGNIHPETTIEEICNVVRGGLLHHIRYIPDKHICFVTFIDPTAAASFYALSNIQGLMIHNRRLKVGWGKHSGALPPAIALAVSGGASRNVYIGNLDASWNEERLRADFSVFGEVELVNALREKSCAFVNFTNIANAIKAIEGMQGRPEYARFKINFGKDRCGNPPRQVGGGQPRAGVEDEFSPAIQVNEGASPLNEASSTPVSTNSQNYQFRSNGSFVTTPSSILNAGSSNPLTMYLSHVSQQQAAQAQSQDQRIDPMSFGLQQQQQPEPMYHPNIQPPSDEISSLHLSAPSISASNSYINGHVTTSDVTPPPPNGSAAAAAAAVAAVTNNNSASTLDVPRAASHSRAISLPSHPFGRASAGSGSSSGNPAYGHQSRQSLARPLPSLSHHQSQHQPQSSFSGFPTGLGGNLNGFGLGVREGPSLGGWAEEQIRAK